MTRWGILRQKHSKFGNRPTRCRQAMIHHSGLEAARCDELHAMQDGGLIRELEAHPQPRYDLVVNEVSVTRYLPDFRYVDAETGEPIVEDVKGVRTREYEIKKRLMLACHGVEIQEVSRVRGRR
jgi:hypothetical protein